MDGYSSTALSSVAANVSYTASSPDAARSWSYAAVVVLLVNCLVTFRVLLLPILRAEVFVRTDFRFLTSASNGKTNNVD